jgi:potassium voltage-gated channel Shab-related subfamily B protein 1
VILSSFTFCLSTIKELNIKIIKGVHKSNLSSNLTFLPLLSSENDINPIFEIIEIVSITWFTVEFLLRIWSAPHKIRFIKNPLNCIDLVSILPYYMSLIFARDEFKVIFYEANNIRAFRLFRIFRIIRILKLARHSDGLKSLGKTLKTSYNELGVLLMFLAITVLIFSSLAYFAEKDVPNTDFSSIPRTFW